MALCIAWIGNHCQHTRTEARMYTDELARLLDRAITAREAMFDARHEVALRLFNGFVEGCADLVIDLYATTAVIHNYADPPENGSALVDAAQHVLLQRLPWLRAILLKIRRGATPEERNGKLVYGTMLDRKVREHGIWYAVELAMNRDASLYLDTRNLRQWAINNLRGKSVLNTFAYTGSLGVAACGGGASRVVHLDLNKQFLNVAKTSYTLNGFPINKQDFLAGDFWPLTNRLKRAGERFDCVLIDPPFFAATQHAVLDLAHDITRLINKVRPLVHDGGHIVAINNALFLSGQAYIEALESLCHDGYVSIAELIPVPPDFTGFPQTQANAPITDPTPFNHSTKIAVLHIRHTRQV
jgi:23S rRNA (cytosine1962-C5)-methyltransferase